MARPPLWDQCTLTAQAAQGPHEQRTLTQLRADVAAALLLNQSLAQNNIFAPPLPEADHSAPDAAQQEPQSASIVVINDQEPPDEEICSDPCRGRTIIHSWQIPVFDDPDYDDPAFKDPDIRNLPDCYPTSKPPDLKPPPTSSEPAGTTTSGLVWPPHPQAMPVILIPALSLLGATNQPAWMEGIGPISMEVAKRLTEKASSIYRVLTDPISNWPLDIAPERYRITKAMRTTLRIRDEFCQFPGCMAKAATSDVDHIQKFESGGTTTFINLESLCLHHHLLRHFKDDETRAGEYRTDQFPERAATRLRG